jgi:hypothetical protein
MLKIKIKLSKKIAIKISIIINHFLLLIKINNLPREDKFLIKKKYCLKISIFQNDHDPLFLLEFFLFFTCFCLLWKNSRNYLWLSIFSFIQVDFSIQFFILLSNNVIKLVLNYLVYYLFCPLMTIFPIYFPRKLSITFSFH